MIDKSSLELITSVDRENVSYIYADKAEKKLLAYMSHDPATKITVCHVFATKDAARTMLLQICTLVNIPHDVKRQTAAPTKKKAKDAETAIEDMEELPMQVFSAEFMGTTLVSTPHPHSEADIQRGLLTLKQNGRRSLQKVYFAVSSDSVQIVDRDTERPIHTSRLREISYCGIDQTNKKIVGLVISAPDLSFQCLGLVFPGKTQLVTSVINAAFVIAAEKMKKDQQKKALVRSASMKPSMSSVASPSQQSVASPRPLVFTSPAPNKAENGADLVKSPSAAKTTASDLAPPAGSTVASPAPSEPSRLQRMPSISFAEERQTEEQKRQGGSALNVFEAQFYGCAPAGDQKNHEGAIDATRLILVS